MTVSALTRPGERDRLINKFGEIDWIFCLTITLIAGAGAVMLFSIAGSSWTPWAAPHLARYALFFCIMIVLSLIDIRVWFALAYAVHPDWASVAHNAIIPTIPLGGVTSGLDFLVIAIVGTFGRF